MKLSTNAMVSKIADTYVIIPIGQAVVDQQNLLQLNTSGAFIVQCLESEIAYTELLHRLVNQYEAVGDEVIGLKDDLDAFLETLRLRGLLDDGTDAVPQPEQ